MNTIRFNANKLGDFFKENIIATMPEMKQALETNVDKTVLRKLKELSYRTSYTHGSSYYTLDIFTKFDKNGLWSIRSVWFSYYGTLVATLEHFINISEAGYFAHELKECLHVSVKETLLKLARRGQITREKISGLYLYCSSDKSVRRQQLLARQFTQTEVEGFSDEVKAAIIIFASVLDEKQRRLYAGLEALRIGHGGDKRIAELFGLHSNTVARGRRELLEQDIELERTRKEGAGRKPVEKKFPKSSQKSKN